MLRDSSQGMLALRSNGLKALELIHPEVRCMDPPNTPWDEIMRDRTPR